MSYLKKGLCVSVKDNDVFTGVDLGSSAIRVMIARINAQNDVDILGFSEQPFSAINQGMITDLHQTADVVEKLIIDAEDQADIEVKHVVVNVGGEHVSSYACQSAVPIKHSDQKIRNIDLYRAAQGVMNPRFSNAYQVLHTEVVHFIVDDVVGVKQPLKMVANELKANLHVFVGKRNLIQNVMNVFDLVGVSVEGFFANAYVVGEAVLAEEEKELGVICIDIGSSSSDVLVYHSGQLKYGFSMPVGYDRITNHLAHSLCISREQALDINKKYAYVGPLGVGEDREILLQKVAQATFSKVSPDRLSQLIQEELEGLFRSIDLRLQEEDAKTDASAGVVLTGGIANLKGVCSVAEQVLQKSVRIGSVNCKFLNKQEFLKGYQYALCVGLLRAAHQKRRHSLIRKPSRVERVKTVVGHFFSDLF